MIYGYALYEPNGLHFQHSDDRVPRLYSNPEPGPKEKVPWNAREANQLKYTCRELWHDTRGRSLKLNILHFTQTTVTSWCDRLSHEVSEGVGRRKSRTASRGQDQLGS